MTPDDVRFSGVADFDFDQSLTDSWRLFSERLAEVLSVMDAGASLRIGALAADPDTVPPHIRFTCGAGGALHAHGSDGSFDAEGTQEDAQELAAAASEVLRETYGVPHPALLSPDQLADILTGPAPLPLTGPADDHEQLEAHVHAELVAMLGHEALRDDDGDLALRVGSTMVFVRVTPDAQEVVVFAPLVHDVQGRSHAMEVLSDLNTEARWVRFLLIRDKVYLMLSVFAQPFVPAHLRKALSIVSQISDAIDGELATKLRGRTTFSPEAE